MIYNIPTIARACRLGNLSVPYPVNTIHTNSFGGREIKMEINGCHRKVTQRSWLAIILKLSMAPELETGSLKNYSMSMNFMSLAKYGGAPPKPAADCGPRAERLVPL